MPEVTLTVRHEVGLHARPAAQFVKTARQFEASDIKVIHGEGEADAKAFLDLLTLGINQGSQITIRAEGEGADEALAALKALIEGNLGEVE